MKPIPDHAHYFSDKQGNIYSEFKNRWGFGKSRRLKARLGKRGHFYVCLTVDGQHRWRYVHELILLTFVGPRPDGMLCLHGKRGQQCNELANLSYGTQSKNMGEDRRRDGTLRFGETCPVAKLTKRQAEFALVSKGSMKAVDVAKMFGVSSSAVSAIRRRRNWHSIGESLSAP